MRTATLDTITDRQARKIADRYKRVSDKHDKARDDLTRARRAVSKAFDVLGDPSTVSLTVDRVLGPDGPDTLTRDQAWAIASWENARSRARAYSQALRIFTDALDAVEGR